MTKNILKLDMFLFINAFIFLKWDQHFFVLILFILKGELWVANIKMS